MPLLSETIFVNWSRTWSRADVIFLLINASHKLILRCHAAGLLVGLSGLPINRPGFESEFASFGCVGPKRTKPNIWLTTSVKKYLHKISLITLSIYQEKGRELDKGPLQPFKQNFWKENHHQWYYHPFEGQIILSFLKDKRQISTIYRGKGLAGMQLVNHYIRHSYDILWQPLVNGLWISNMFITTSLFQRVSCSPPCPFPGLYIGIILSRPSRRHGVARKDLQRS